MKITKSQLREIILEAINESRIPKPINDLITMMVNQKIHQKTVKIGDDKKHARFMKDVEPAIKAKLLRIDHNGSEMKITLGSNAQKMIGEETHINEMAVGDKVVDKETNKQGKVVHVNSNQQIATVDLGRGLERTYKFRQLDKIK